MSKHDPHFLESLNEERIKEIEARWAAESEERIDAVEQGELETVDGPSALRNLRSSLTKLRGISLRSSRLT